MTISVDLGSGPVPKNPFGADEVYGVDITSFPGKPHVKVADLSRDSIPFSSNSVDFVVGTDFLEHIPRTGYKISGMHKMTLEPILVMTNPFLHVMSEVWRVLKPGGLTQFKTPAYPAPEVFQDPTHVNFITENTADYFAGGMLPLTQQYGFNGEFKFAYPQRWEGFWLVWEFEAVK